MLKYGILIGGVLLLIVAAVFFTREKLPQILYERVEVPVEAITDVEPDTVVQWRERIVYRTVTPTQVADAPEGAADDVAAFCAQMIHEATPDTTRPAFDGPDRLLIRSGRKDGARLILTGPVSDGTLRQTTLDGIRGDYMWRVTGDSILMQSSRWWWVGDCTADLALGGGAGAGAGALGNNLQTGAIVGGGLGALRCLVRFF